MYNFSLYMVNILVLFSQTRAVPLQKNFPENLERLEFCHRGMATPYWQEHLTPARSNIRTSQRFVDSTAGWCVSLRLTGHGVRSHRPERSPLTSTTAGRNPGTTTIKPHSLMVALNCCSEIRWFNAKLVE